jgi:PAS domain S-box-containing protein
MQNERKQIERATIDYDRFIQVEEELKTRLDQQAALAKLSYRALSSSDLSSLMDDTVELVAQTLNAELCKILQLLPDGNNFKLLSGSGWNENLIGRATVSAGVETHVGYTLHTDEPILVDDLTFENRFIGSDLLRSHNVVSGMTVVIPGKEQPFGVLAVHTTQKRLFTHDDATFLRNVSNVLASAIIRFKAEEVMRSSRDQLAVILQGVSEGITVQDHEGKIIYANQKAAELLGFKSEKDLMNSHISAVANKFVMMQEDGSPFPLNQLPGRQALAGEKEPSAVIRFQAEASGEERYAHVKANPIYDSSGAVKLAINIFQDITQYKRTEQQRSLLSEAGDLLTSTLEPGIILKHIAKLSVKHLSDWCVVHTVDDDHRNILEAVEHADPDKISLAQELLIKYQPKVDAKASVSVVLKTGRAVFYPQIDDQIIAAVTQDNEHKRLLMELGLKSAIILPMVARGKVIGILSLVWAESKKRYGQQEVNMAEELARLSALALDNARLYQGSQAVNEELEKRVNKRTSQLQSIITKLKSEISERKKAEEALQQSEKMLESLFESAPDGAILVDSDGVIQRINAQVEILFGYQRNELTGKKVELLLPEQYRQLHLDHRKEFFEKAVTRTMGAGLDLFGRRKDGSMFPVDIMLSPVKTEQGVFVIAAVRDITERKQMEAELLEVQSRLFESLEAERLHLAQELHDGPIQELYSVSFSLDGLNSDGNHSMEDTVLQLKEMVNRVIGTLRATCGELRPPTLAPFGLEKAIRAHVEKIHEAHPELEVELDLVPDGQLLPERLRLALYRIYQHAVSNVLRHANATSLAVRLNFDVEKLELEIRDNGCGFDLPSKWVELARKGNFGLVGTLERAEAIGGQLKIDTSPGKGTKILVIVHRALDGDAGYTSAWT